MPKPPVLTLRILGYSVTNSSRPTFTLLVLSSGGGQVSADRHGEGAQQSRSDAEGARHRSFSCLCALVREEESPNSHGGTKITKRNRFFLNACAFRRENGKMNAAALGAFVPW